MHNSDSDKAIIDAALKKVDPSLSAHFIRADDPESEDDEFVVRKGEEEFRAPLDGEEVGYRIQCCMYGGGYAVNRDHYKDGELDGVAFLMDTNNVRAAANKVAMLVKEHCV